LSIQAAKSAVTLAGGGIRTVWLSLVDMKQSIGYVTLVVQDYDEAIRFGRKI
jgi:hypothetical protein